jgi:oleandomycin transport system permease protein
MTAVTLDPGPPVPQAAVPERPGLRRTLRHTRALCGRNLRALVLRTPQLLLVDAARPILLTLLFTYVLGGSIMLPGGEPYLSYLLPGILVQQVAFSSAIIAAGMSVDIRNGILDRFRSLPIARSAYLIARILSDTVRMLLSVALVVVVGLALGFRFGGGSLAAAAGLLLVLAFGVAFAWVSVAVATAMRDPETAQGVWFITLMPLLFASSIFASPSNMPGWLQPVVKANPLTVVSDATRGLLLGGPVATPLWQSAAWIAGITVVFFTLAVRGYRRVA